MECWFLSHESGIARFNQALYKDHYLLRQISFRNFFMKNLFEEYFCRKSILIIVELLFGSNKPSPCNSVSRNILSKVFKGEAKPNPGSCSRRYCA
jgi:hypothetical protein